MTKKWIIALLLLPGLGVGAQSIRLTRYDAPGALYFSADNLYNFNMYERSRLELGLAWVWPNEAATVQRRASGQWMLLPYVAYGTGDHGWKYGLGTLLRLRGRQDVRLGLWLYDDVERAASRRLGEYGILNTSLNDRMVTSRFSGVKGGNCDVTFTSCRGVRVRVGLRQTWEDYRFDSRGCLYPAIDAGQQGERRMFSEVRGRMDWPSGVTLALTGGRMAPTGAGADREASRYVQALAQYDADLGKWGLHLYAQTGFASQEAPYSRMFDLSGTAYAMYFFKHSFLTVRPNVFTANVFAHVCLNYTAPLPLWELSWSAPHPFLQVNAMWGCLSGQDERGQRVWEELPLQAPNRGLLEPATGFDRLVHWGLLDVGFGVAYQICPLSAAYFNEDPGDNIAVVVVADLILDRYK